MAELAREDAPAAVEPSAPSKRHLEQTTNPQAELPKRARTSESADEAAPEPEDARPSESAGDEAEPQDDEAAPQREEEDATPFSRGVAIAEIEIMQFVERLRYVHVRNTTLADDIEATIVTTAAQRQAALLPSLSLGGSLGSVRKARCSWRFRPKTKTFMRVVTCAFFYCVLLYT